MRSGYDYRTLAPAEFIGSDTVRMLGLNCNNRSYCGSAAVVQPVA